MLSEAKLQHDIQDSIKGRTTIIIAHPLSTIRSADQLIGMKDGRIVETGVFPNKRYFCFIGVKGWS